MIKKIILLSLIILLSAGTANSQSSRFNRKPLLIQEEDGSPSKRARTLKVTNDTLTDNGDGTVSLNTGGGGGDVTWQDTPPTSPTQSATHPTMSSESGWLYVTISDNTWERVAIATWTPPAVEGSLLLSDGTSFLLLSDGTSKLNLE